MNRIANSSLSAVIILLVPVIGAMACTHDSGPENHSPFLGRGKWALHVQVGSDRQTVDFVPDAAASRNGVGAITDPHPQGIKTFGVPNAALSTAPASALLYAAAVECNAKVVNELVIPPQGNDMGNLIAPWSGAAPPGSWFVFRTAPATCDDLMRDEQIMACMADKLAEISDTVNVVKWANVGALFTALPGPWQILPQSDLNRFISRDLAIYTLANLAQLDGSKIAFVGGGSGGPYFVDNLTCAEAYSLAYRNPSWGPGHTGQLFAPPGSDTPQDIGQTPYSDPSTIPVLAEQRLALETHTLRAGARMTHDLIEQSVYADLAGAAHRAGQASDPLRANKEIWGEEDPYDSLAHAMRILAGRWDGAGMRTFGGHWDASAGPMGVLAGIGYGGFREVPIRKLDLPISRQGQADAATLVQHAGIVADASVLSSPRDVLKQQLLVVAAIAAKAIDLSVTPVNCTLPPGFETTPEGLRVAEALAPLSDADLRFGVEYAARTFQLVTRTDLFRPQTGETALQSLPSACIVSGLATAGTVVKGGIGRDYLPTDHTPRALEGARKSTMYGAQLVAKDWGFANTASPNSVIFQDSFGIARAFSWRLGIMQSVTSTFGATFESQKIALDAVAEMRPWTGGGTVYVDETDTPDCPPSAWNGGGDPPPACITFVHQYTIRLEGFLPSDLGVDSYDHLVGALAFSNDAECSMKLRPDCLTPASEADVPAGWMTWNASQLVVTITLPPTRSFLSPWLFSRQLKVGGGPAFVAPLEPAGVYQDSPMRRQLFNAMFKFADGERTHDPRIGDRGVGLSDAYCIPGVSRDMFVPLSNELTSTGSQFEDSWKHYLTVAHQAAQRADELAQKTIDLGVQQDTRREAAAEKLGQICGDISALDQVAVNGDGTINAGAADDSLKQCMNEPRCDVVFLTKRIPATVTVPELKDLLRCSSNGNSDLCKRLAGASKVVDCLKADPAQLADQTAIKVSSLNLYDLQTPPGEASCASLTLRANELREAGRGFEPSLFSATLGEGWTAPERMQALAYRVQMRVSPLDSSPSELAKAGAWSVVAGGTTIMSTDDPVQGSSAVNWPACLRGSVHCDFANHPELKRLNTIFRSTCTGGGDRENCALGVPEGSDERTELNALRWRVQGALWQLGMLGGGVPSAMFTTPLPAVDFGSVPVGTLAPLATIYGGSCFDGAGHMRGGAPGDAVTGSPNCFYSDPADVGIVGVTSSLSGSAFAVWGTSSAKLPSWYRAIFAPGSAYRLVPGVSNAEEESAKSGGLSVGGIAEILKNMGGATCPNYYGDANRPAADQDDLVRQLGLSKELWTVNDRLASSGQNGAWFTPSLVNFELHRLFVGWAGQPYYVVGAVGDTRIDHPIDVTCYDPQVSYSDGQFTGYSDETNITYGIHCEGMWDHGHYSGSIGDHLNTGVRAMPPQKRARAFLNSSPPPDACGGLSELIGAYAVACAAGETGPVDAVLGDAPTVTSPADLARFRRWLTTLEFKVKDRGAHFFAQGVPVRAVQDQAAGQVTRGSLKGDHGDTVVAIETGLANVGNDWVTIATNVHALNEDLEKAQAIIDGIKDARNAKIKELAFGLARAMIADAGQVVSGAIQIVKGTGEIALAESTGGASAIVGVADVSSGINGVVSGQANAATSLASYNVAIDAANAAEANQIYQTLLGLSRDATQSIGSLQKGITSLRTDVIAVSSTGDKLRRGQELAAYYAAQGLGADYVKTPDGVTTTIPLNTVLRRQFDGTRTRYARALRDAKALAFIARRAIEQRLGVSLTDLHDSVGSLEAPATWADSVCHMTGIDYARLRGIGASVSTQDGGTTVNLDPATGDGGFDRAAVDAYADGFIGDYVAKLQNFVDYYNVQYPSHQSDDIAILSLREDFLRAPNACVARGANLLLHSSQLNVQPEGDPLHGGKGGWEYHPCISASKCLRATDSLGDPEGVAPQDAVRARVTLLSDQAIPGAGVSDAGVDGGSTTRDARGRVVANAPPGLVSQAVVLDAGAYVLSWWDQARGAEAGPDAGMAPPSTTPYRVEVLDSRWTALTSYSNLAAATGWGPRHSLSFTVSAAGVHHIAFGASGSGLALGAVAISGVQVEKTGNNGTPTAYVETTASLDAYTTVCPTPPASSLQAAFTRKCDDPTGACYYELNAPLAIDAVTLQTGTSPIAGKVARGNFNYRHVNIALNFVGTGVRTCPSGSSQSCYGSGFTEYTLFHDAEQVPILDWSGTPHYFDFETGRIEHGKALSAERYITLPLGSADQSLIAQPAIQKVEMQGRPLDGRYRLRIWDNPALRWDRLEDVQLVIQYRYWSKVARDNPPTR